MRDNDLADTSKSALSGQNTTVEAYTENLQHIRVMTNNDGKQSSNSNYRG